MNFKKEYLKVCAEFDPILNGIEEEINRLDTLKQTQIALKWEQVHLKKQKLSELAQELSKYKMGQLLSENNGTLWKVLMVTPQISFDKTAFYILYSLVRIGCNGKETKDRPVNKSEKEISKSMVPVESIKDAIVIPKTLWIKKLQLIKESQEWDKNLYLLEDTQRRLFTFEYTKLTEKEIPVKLHQQNNRGYRLYVKDYRKSKSRWIVSNLKPVTKKDIPKLMECLL